MTTPEVCRRFAAESRTGCLRIRSGDVLALVFFRAGRIYTATAPEARARLGDRLLGAGLITPHQLSRALEEQRNRRPSPRLGEILIEHGIVDREAIRVVVREQITDSVTAAVSWTTGEWTWSDGEEVPEDVPLGMTVPDLLMEATRRLEELEVIRGRLGSLDAVVDFDAAGGAADLSLTPDEWSMLTRINGSASIAEIAEDAGYGQLEAARIIYGLLSAGVVHVVDDGLGDDAAAAGGAAQADAGDGALRDAGGAGPSRADDVSPWESFDAALDAAPPPDAPTAPAARPAEAAPPRNAATNDDRRELMREFAGLDDADDEDAHDERRGDGPPGAAAPRERLRPGAPPPGPPADEEPRKGFLGRFRRPQ